MKKFIQIAMMFSIFFSLVACTSSDAQAVRVASMIDAEGNVLGQMVIAVLEDAGIQTEDKTSLGTPDILRAALENQEVDLIIDYTGSGQYYHPEEASDPSLWNDPQVGYETTKQLDEALGFIWLTPAPANNTESIALRRAFATEQQLVDMQDLADYINAGKPFKLIAAAGFVENPMGLLGFEEAYGFKLSSDQLVILSSGNTTEMLQALSQSTDDINASLVYGTDGALSQLDLVVLEDPKHVPPVYLPAPIIRQEVLDLYPEIETLLKPVFESLDLVTLQGLNEKVAYDGLSAKDVARAYLEEKNFIQP